MSKVLFRSVAWSLRWSCVFCLSMACSSEEGVGNGSGGDGSGGAGAGTGSDGGSSSGTGGMTSAGGASTGGASTGGATPSGGATANGGSGTAVGGSSGGSANGSGGSGDGGALGTGGTGAGSMLGSGGSDGGAGTGGQSPTGGSGPMGDCTPNPGGTFVAAGEEVLDETTCLTWMQSDVTGHPYTAADAYCAELNLGGHDDWRLPTAGEATTIFHCDGTYPPVYDVFTAMYDGIWTTTETGTIAGDEPKVCGAGQASGQFYDFGKVGAQNTRCVRGDVTVADRTDCKTVTQICP